jgi:hypothetical protein
MPTQPVTIPSYSSKHIFLDEPTQTIPLKLDDTHLSSLDGNKFLDMGTIDYLIQQSIKTKTMNKQSLHPVCLYLLCKLAFKWELMKKNPLSSHVEMIQNY